MCQVTILLHKYRYDFNAEFSPEDRRKTNGLGTKPTLLSTFDPNSVQKYNKCIITLEELIRTYIPNCLSKSMCSIGGVARRTRCSCRTITNHSSWSFIVFDTSLIAWSKTGNRWIKRCIPQSIFRHLVKARTTLSMHRCLVVWVENFYRW